MHPEIDRYAHLDSFLHRWDPRWKLAALAALTLAIAAVPAPVVPRWDRDVPHALASLGVALALVELSRIPLGFALKRTFPAIAFLLCFVVVYSLIGTPEGGWKLAFELSAGRFATACIIAVRALAVVLLVLPLFGTSRFDVTMKALRALRVPAPFVQLIVFAYRYLYVYLEELRRMRGSMRARGFAGRPFLHAVRTTGNMVGMLLVRSVERTEAIHDAMVARGYSGSFRTLQDFSTRPRDVVKTAAVLIAAGLLLALGIAP